MFSLGDCLASPKISLRTSWPCLNIIIRFNHSLVITSKMKRAVQSHDHELYPYMLMRITYNNIWTFCVYVCAIIIYWKMYARIIFNLKSFFFFFLFSVGNGVRAQRICERCEIINIKKKICTNSVVSVLSDEIMAWIFTRGALHDAASEHGINIF